MGEAKRNAARRQEVARAPNKLWRALLIRSLYFHVLPLIAVIVAASVSQGLLAPAVSCLGISLLIYVRLSVRDGAVIQHSSVCERKVEPVLFWCTMGIFAAIGLGMLIVGLALGFTEGG